MGEEDLLPAGKQAVVKGTEVFCRAIGHHVAFLGALDALGVGNKMRTHLWAKCGHRKEFECGGHMFREWRIGNGEFFERRPVVLVTFQRWRRISIRIFRQ